MKKLVKFVALAATFVSAQAFSQCADITVPGVWDAVNTGTNPVVATTTNAMSGTCAMAVPVESGKRYVQDNMDQEFSFRGTFQIDPNSSAWPETGTERKVKVHNVQCAAGCDGSATVDWMQMKIRKNSDAYKMGIWAREANLNKINVTLDLLDGCNTIEYQLIAGNPGTFRVWVNNSTEASPDFETTTADFSGRYTDRVRLGRTGTGNNIASGTTLYMDTFESRRQTFIGNTCP